MCGDLRKMCDDVTEMCGDLREMCDDVREISVMSEKCVMMSNVMFTEDASKILCKTKFLMPV